MFLWGIGNSTHGMQLEGKSFRYGEDFGEEGDFGVVEFLDGSLADKGVGVGVEYVLEVFACGEDV